MIIICNNIVLDKLPSFCSMDVCDCAVIVEGVKAASRSTAGSSSSEAIFNAICSISSPKVLLVSTASGLKPPSAAELPVINFNTIISGFHKRKLK